VSRLKVLPFRELAKIAEQSGFELTRREGSHCTFRNADGKIVVIPDHGNHVIVRPLLRKIIRDLGLSLADYESKTKDL
jgi:predicted RNA binding protein YcfA (HicA-like mRNA interferase family)